MPRVSDIAVHPVKSLAGAHVASASVEPWGLAGDRRWMVVDEAGATVTARELKALLGVGAGLVDGGIELSAPGRPSLVVPEPVGGAVVPVGMSRVGTATAAGEAADSWLSATLGRPLRLVWLDDPTRRTVAEKHGGRPGDVVAFSDTGPIHLCTTASLAALNQWLADEQGEGPLPMERFRPTIVVDGDLEPFAEDTWAVVRIGDVAFRFSEHCDRCVMTTVDRGTLRTTKEPIRTLARHRRHAGNVWFGIRMIPLTTGVVSVGDEVLVEPAADVVGEFGLAPVPLP